MDPLDVKTLHRDALGHWLGAEVVHEQTRQTRLLLVQLTCAASVPLALLAWRPGWFSGEGPSLVLTAWLVLLAMTGVWWLLEWQALRRKRRAQAVFQARDRDGTKPG